MKADKFLGLLLGVLTGDCLGLPFEMLSPGQKIKIYGRGIDHKFIHIPFGARLGICSDDTDHIWLTALALLKANNSEPRMGQCAAEIWGGRGQSSGNRPSPTGLVELQSSPSFQAGAVYFGRELARYLRNWFLTCPVGIGRATLLSCLKLLVGVSPLKSGIQSAGNGAAVRALMIGALYSDDLPLLTESVKVSTAITHTDPRAYEGSLAVALAAATAMRSDLKSDPAGSLFDSLWPYLENPELKHFLTLAQQHLSLNSSLSVYLKDLSLPEIGVSGYINHTVPAVIFAWLRYYGDYRETVGQLIAAGGDTDSTAALAGGLCGLVAGQEGIAADWLNGACGWPLRRKHFYDLSRALASADSCRPPSPPAILFLLRNALTAPFFMFHLIRRVAASLF